MALLLYSLRHVMVGDEGSSGSRRVDEVPEVDLIDEMLDDGQGKQML